MKKTICFILLIFSLQEITAQTQTTDTSGQTSDSVIIASDISFKGPVYKTVTGIASFYSIRLDGTQTATGEIFRNNKLTAASNNFKLNIWVRVTNLINDKTVIVRINDRMHKRMQKKGRVIDLSRAAASQLGFIKQGLTKVKVEEVPKGILK
jgi:rare lipoprotein A